MILKREGYHPGEAAHASHPGTEVQAAIELAAAIAGRYQISALSGLLATARTASRQDEISVAILGRFKAGKSSFLNDFFGRSILPVGVVPVTAVVTEIRYGVRERACLRRTDGQTEEIPLAHIGEYISERENPENAKQVGLISIELPDLRRFRGLKFVDTPGLESALTHNTQASLDWLPNAGLALVAVSVDPPLSQRDIDLLRSLYQFTPKVAVLLTKADLLCGPELAEVVDFVRTQLSRHLPGTPQVFPYSTKPGFEHFRQAVEITLFAGMLERFPAERESIVARKVDTLLRDCSEYLNLSLKAAESTQSKRRDLKEQVLGEKQSLDEVKSQIRIMVQHAAARTRALVSDRLETHQNALEAALTEDFERQFPDWTTSLAKMLSSFEEWLASALRDELMELSIRESAGFIEPLRNAQRREAGLSRTATASRPAVRTNHAGGRCTPPDDGNRNLRSGAWSPEYSGRPGIRSQLGAAVSHFAGRGNPIDCAPPFCADDFACGLSEHQPPEQPMGREREQRAVERRKGGRAAPG